MPYESLNLGINLTLPTPGTSNWGPTLKGTTWTRISQHSHTGSGDGNLIGTPGLQNGAVTTAKIAANAVTSDKLALNIAQSVAAPLVPAGTTQTIDFNLGTVQTLDLSSATGDVTLTLSNPAVGGFYTLWVIQGAIFRDLIFPASVKWPQAQAPILTQATGAIDQVILYWNGTNYLADWQVNWG
jgi:hypothetical protein